MDPNGRPVKARSHDGCWTCRSRKKKCAAGTFPCEACIRLGLACDFGPRLIWETDARRPGIRSRGPKKGTKRHKSLKGAFSRSSSHPSPVSTTEEHEPLGNGVETSCSWLASESSLPAETLAWQIGWRRTFGDFPGLESTEYLLLDHYIHKFSRTYPAFPGPSNPFLSVFAPIAAKSNLVLYSLLALGGIQGLNNSNIEVTATTLRTRQRALTCCRQLLARNASAAYCTPLATMGKDDLLFVLASCMLLLLYEKLTGEGQANWEPHFQFISQVVACYESRSEKAPSSWTSKAFDFLHSLFAYHDLLRAMQLRIKAISTFYGRTGQDATFHYPRLIARICAADVNVTEADLCSWDGNMEWLPSFSPNHAKEDDGRQAPSQAGDDNGDDGDNGSDSLPRALPRETTQPGRKEGENLSMLSELYRASAILLRKQIWHARQPEDGDTMNSTAHGADRRLSQRSELAAQGMSLVDQLVRGSRFKSALLWPISIIMRDLRAEQVMERTGLISCLDSLSGHFHLNHFTCLRASLESAWSQSAHERGRLDQTLPPRATITAETMLLG